MLCLHRQSLRCRALHYRRRAIESRLRLLQRWQRPYDAGSDHPTAVRLADLSLLHHGADYRSGVHQRATTNNEDTFNSGEWPELFFPSGTEFWDQSGTDQGTLGNPTGGELGTGFFKYTYPAKPGSNADCPNMTSQWRDASPDSGTLTTSGNILAPDNSGC